MGELTENVSVIVEMLRLYGKIHSRVRVAQLVVGATIEVRLNPRMDYPGLNCTEYIIACYRGVIMRMM